MLNRAFFLWMAVLATLVSSGAVQADSRRQVKGVIVSLDASGTPDLLVVRTDKGQDIQIAVTSNTAIKLGGNRRGDFDDLEVGDQVQVHHGGNFVATKIDVKERKGDDDDDDDLAEIRGVITAIDTAADPDRVTIRQANGVSVTLLVTAATKIEVEGDDDAGIADLAVGDVVKAEFAADTFQAVKIEVEEDNDDQELEVRGVLVDLQPGVALIDTTGDGQADLQLTLDPNAQFKLGDLKLDEDELDLLLGLPVRVEYRPGATAGTGVLLELKAETQEAVTLQGVVEDLDLGTRHLVLRTAANELIDLVIPEGLRITRAGRPVELSAVAEGDQVKVLALLDAEEDDGVALRVELQAPVLKKVNGRITSVAGNTLTVLVGNRQNVVLVVNANTRFTLKNRPATLADIAAALSQGRKVQAQVTYREQPGDDLAVEVKASANAK